MLIKEAVQSLFDKKQITIDEYNLLNNSINELEKISALSPNVSRVLDAARIGLLGLGAGTGLTLGGSELYKHLKQQSDIARSYNLMQEKVPALTEYPQDRIQDYFEVIKTFSPKSASNPLVAGALVHKMLEFGGVDHKLVQDLSSMENTHPGIFNEIAKAGLGGIMHHKSDSEE
jgi:hypothetical protein